MAETPAGGASVLQFPEPPARRRRRTVLIGAGVVVVVIALIMSIVLFSPALALKDVSVRGTKILTQQAVQEQLKPLLGKPLPRITKDEVGQLLQPVIQIKSWEVEFRPPNAMVVSIVERTPVAVLKNRAGLSLVDADGTALAKASGADSAKLPLVDATSKSMTPDVLRTVTNILGTLPPSVLALLSDVSAQSVDSVTLNLKDGKKAIWGNAENMELKSKVLQALLKAPVDPANPVNVYDVSTPRHPVTK
ncbi:FtsQ-type POTRA domain-containing protein [Arthrobacter sp. NPDC090010]|uniref:FtsQ-type POTRA domain-containing protein n=1 Tax=Arthrobacter sp. NPDC090010 TaxID=3363942 RepID=UPI0037F7B348